MGWSMSGAVGCRALRTVSGWLGAQLHRAMPAAAHGAAQSGTGRAALRLGHHRKQHRVGRQFRRLQAGSATRSVQQARLRVSRLPGVTIAVTRSRGSGRLLGQAVLQTGSAT